MNSLNNIENPILIAAPIRTGSTMIAWLLHLHGIWIGNANLPKYGDNPSVGTENVDILMLLERQSDKNFLNKLSKIVPAQQRWLFKNKRLLQTKCWQTMYYIFPEAIWIFPFRGFQAIKNSRLRKYETEEAVKQKKVSHKKSRARLTVIKNEYQQQKQIKAKVKYGLWINSDKIARKDYNEIKKLCNFCGVTVNKEVCEDWIDPSRWHLQ